jgi:hypothetical protein
MVLPIISALWRLRQEDEEFEISLGYTERAYLKKKKGRKKGRKKARKEGRTIEIVQEESVK